MLIFILFLVQTLITHGALEVNYDKLCESLLKLSKSIRFTAIATLDGRIISTKLREGVVPLLTREDSELSIMQSVIRMSIRRTLEDKLGKTLYSVTVYEKITRATISLIMDGPREYDLIFMISFDKNADHERIINTKILPFLKKKAKLQEQQF